jgi:hypothetical protein
MKAGDNTFDLGVGLQLLSCQCTAGNWSVEAVYDHEWRSRGYSADQGLVRLTARF